MDVDSMIRRVEDLARAIMNEQQLERFHVSYDKHLDRITIRFKVSSEIDIIDLWWLAMMLENNKIPAYLYPSLE